MVMQNDTIIDGDTFTGGGGGEVSRPVTDSSSKDSGPQINPGPGLEQVENATVTNPTLGFSPFGMSGGGLNLPSFTFEGRGPQNTLKPAGIIVIMLALGVGGYFLYKKYAK
jgi:hypothetical protein